MGRESAAKWVKSADSLIDLILVMGTFDYYDSTGDQMRFVPSEVVSNIVAARKHLITGDLEKYRQVLTTIPTVHGIREALIRIGAN